MDYKKTALEVYEKIGGRENLVSAAHCATRLRLVIADNEKCDSKAVENIDGVKGVFFASGQMQIIFGTGIVNKVYEEFIAAAGISASTKDEAKEAAAAKQNIFKRAIKTLGDIFVPIIPAIVASGFLMGIMESLNFMVANGFLNIDTSGSIYNFAQIFANTAYTFLPILIAFSAARAFGGNPFLGAVIGMIMIHPNLQNAWTVATEGVLATQEVFFGLYSVDMVGYQGHVIPVIIAVWVMSFIEKRLHKIVPPMIDLFVTPLVSVFVTGYLTLAAIGPVFVFVENWVLTAVQALLTLPFGIGSFIMGGFYATTVVSGIHHMYTLIDMGQLSSLGLTYWLPLASAANVAQGAAALAVGIKARNGRIKSLALPSSLSAFMGITEPAIFGVNLRFFKPFIGGAIGGACGALYASIVQLGAMGTGVTGIFGILLHLHSPIHYLITMAISVGVAFAVTWIIWKEPQEEAAADSGANNIGSVKTDETSAVKLEAGEELRVLSPVSGRAIPLSDVPDPTFAAEILGKGIAVEPSGAKCRVVAPFDGKVTAVVDTRHAVGLMSDKGVEILIHVGVDTVKLEGRHFTTKVSEGDNVKAGDVLIEFDAEAIAAEGYSTVTPVLVVNHDEFKELNTVTGCEVKELDKVIAVER